MDNTRYKTSGDLIPDWLIDELNHEQERKERSRPFLEMPAPPLQDIPEPEEASPSDRGVVIIPL